MDRPVVRVLVATEAPIAAILRGGPPEHWRVHRWDLETGQVEEGAAFAGTLHPERSAISADGTLLAYFATTRQRGDWARFLAISRVPWLTALAAWRWPERGFAAGAAFAGDRLVMSGVEAGAPFAGRCAIPSGLGAVRDPLWSSVPADRATLPLRHPQRAVRAATGVDLLEVRDGVDLQKEEGVRRYVLAGKPLERVQWAVPSPVGVLTVTAEGRLQVRDADGAVVREDGDVSDPGPSRIKSPERARHW